MKNKLTKLNKTRKWASTSILLFIVSIIPLIVQLKKIPVYNEVLNYWNKNVNSDLFSFYKSRFIIISSVIILINVVTNRNKKDSIKINKKISISIYIYMVLIVISTLFSDYKYTAVYGFPDRYEGLLVQLSYIIIFIGTLKLLKDKKQIKIILSGLIISSVIIGIVGILQFFSFNFFVTEIGGSIINIFEEGYIVFKKDFDTGSFNGIYSTLYNSNTFGHYISIVLPLVFFSMLFVKRKPIKFILSISSVLLLCNLVGSLSRGGFIGTVFTFSLGFILSREVIKENKHYLFSIGILSIIIIISMNQYLNNNIKGTSGLQLKNHHEEDLNIDKIKDFKIENNSLYIFCTDTSLEIKIHNSSLQFYNDEGEKLYLNEIEDKRFEIEDSIYKNYQIVVVDNLIKIQKGKSYLNFAVMEDEFLFLDNKGKVVNLELVESIGFKRLERIGSGRGYIWSRTIPLIKNNLIIGTGPDTFATEFPQNDYKGKLKYMYDAYLVIDKPHNMYLQTAINNGLLALMFFIFICMIYIINFFKGLILNYENKISIPIFTGIIGYLATGFFTDSTVSVSPIFWILLGMGIWINIRRETSY